MPLCVIEKSIFKFIIVGIINTLVGSTIMLFSYNILNFNYWVSSVCNYSITSVLSFFLNKYFTFGVRHWSVFMIIAFVVNIALAYLAAYSVSRRAVNYFLQNSPQKTRENTALIAGMCLFTGLNYLGQRLIVFRRDYHETNT